MKELITKLAVGLFALTLSTGVFAFGCPLEVQKIDEALAGASELTDEQRAEVQALRDEGESLHGAGNHQEAMDTLAQAKEILGIE